MELNANLAGATRRLINKNIDGILIMTESKNTEVWGWNVDGNYYSNTYRYK